MRCPAISVGHTVSTGTNGQLIDKTALQESQDIKIPQLRNLYEKTGFTDAPGVVNKRGFGFTHNGAVDNLFDFLKFPGFNFGSDPVAADAKRRDVEQFLLCFDTGMAPAVGYQMSPRSWATMNGRSLACPGRSNVVRKSWNAGTARLTTGSRSRRNGASLREAGVIIQSAQ